MNPNILLTVAIPTYNRPSTLEKILIQLSEEINQSFATLIVDDYDGPSSKTQDMVERYMGNNPRLIYLKNDHNLGFSANVLHIYELVQTRYVWYVCDDDMLKPGCIDVILSAVKKYQPRVAYFGFTQIDPYGRIIVLQPKEETLWDNLDNFNKHVAVLQGNFLSVVVLEKTNSSLDQIKSSNYKDNVFIQLTLALHLLSDKLRLCMMPTPIVHRNVGFKYGDFYKFNFVDVLKAVYAIDHKFDKKQFNKFAIRTLPTNFLLFLSQKIGLYRFTFNPTRQTLKYIFRFYGIFCIFVFAIPVVGFIIPKFIVKFMYFVKLAMIHGIKKARTIYQMNVNRAYTDERDTGYTSYR